MYDNQPFSKDTPDFKVCRGVTTLATFILRCMSLSEVFDV